MKTSLQPPIIDFDATGKSFGRLASNVAHALQGKNSPAYEPNLWSKQRVVVKNLDKAVFTGKKLSSKIIKKHTQYPGNMKHTRLDAALAKNPQKLFLLTVKRMLPKNKLQDKMLSSITFIS